MDENNRGHSPTIPRGGGGKEGFGEKRSEKVVSRFKMSEVAIVDAITPGRAFGFLSGFSRF